jgi:hypothetical protein
VVSRYKNLADVERFFRTLNTELDVRPIRHRLADRVRAHMFLRAAHSPPLAAPRCSNRGRLDRVGGPVAASNQNGIWGRSTDSHGTTRPFSGIIPDKVMAG